MPGSKQLVDPPPRSRRIRRTILTLGGFVPVQGTCEARGPGRAIVERQEALQVKTVDVGDQRPADPARAHGPQTARVLSGGAAGVVEEGQLHRLPDALTVRIRPG